VGLKSNGHLAKCWPGVLKAKMNSITTKNHLKRSIDRKKTLLLVHISMAIKKINMPINRFNFTKLIEIAIAKKINSWVIILIFNMLLFYALS
jgi:hypothetical protein